MALGISLFRELSLSHLRALRTRTVLIAAMVFTIACITTASLLIVRKQMRQQISSDLSANLSRSVQSFHQLETYQLTNQQRTCLLVADLPSLKALMTTSDSRTIQDGAEEFWRTSESDLFALATRDGTVVVSFTKGQSPSPALAVSLQELLQSPERYEIVDSGRLFSVAVQPVVFGPAASGTVLGYIFTGFAINDHFVAQLSEASAVDISFVGASKVLASSLPVSLRQELPSALPRQAGTVEERKELMLGGSPYLSAVQDLSPVAQGPLLLVLVHSFRQAEEAVHQINMLVLLVGVVATFAGATLMTLLARLVTRPLEALAEDVSAFSSGYLQITPRDGTAEVSALSAAFQSRSGRIAASNAALLDSERLATIGRMASSVSHDLRHYLAAIYANAEFLADPGLSDSERKESYADVRSAVLGTTELIDSLLLFSRPDRNAQPQVLNAHEMMRGARALVEVHPDASEVEIEVQGDMNGEVLVRADARQIERVLLNLILNACQVDRAPGILPKVGLMVEAEPKFAVFSVTDNGVGVAPSVRDHLFEPFVSQGKQKGTGLGLTLVQSLVSEHGGRVALQSSISGQTVFKLWLPLQNGDELPGDFLRIETL